MTGRVEVIGNATLTPAREKRMLAAYGLTAAAFTSLVAAQGGKCPICNFACSTDDFVVDHCHASGAVRGLLCGRCNSALGLLRDSPRAMRAAADYIERTRTADYA